MGGRPASNFGRFVPRRIDGIFGERRIDSYLVQKSNPASQAKYYARVMDRSLAEGPRWVEEEAERLQKSRKREERPAERERSNASPSGIIP